MYLDAQEHKSKPQKHTFIFFHLLESKYYLSKYMSSVSILCYCETLKRIEPGELPAREF